jgi:hypothetical protein
VNRELYGIWLAGLRLFSLFAFVVAFVARFVQKQEIGKKKKRFIGFDVEIDVKNCALTAHGQTEW